MPGLRSVLLLLVLGAVPAAAHAQQPLRCDSLFVEAEATFYEGRFEETLRLLAPCAAPDAPQAVSVAAYRLLTMAYMNSDDAPAARRTVTALLLDNPGYEPDLIQDPPAYAALVGAVREELQRAGRLPRDAPAVEGRPRARLLSFVGATLGLVAVGVAAYLAGEPSF